MTRPMYLFPVSPFTGLTREPSPPRQASFRDRDIDRLHDDLGDMGALLEETEQRRRDRRRPARGHRAEVA